MTAQQLSIILSSLDTQEIVLYINNKEYNIAGVELKVIDQNSKVYIKAEERKEHNGEN